MTAVLFAAVFLLVFCMFDLYNHNKEVKKLFPDELDPEQIHMRKKLTVSFYGYVMILAALVYGLITSIRH